MTPEERAAAFADLEHGNYAYAKGDLVGPAGEITLAIRAAIDEEREACARLCDDLGAEHGHDDYSDGMFHRACAETIRARAK